MKIILEIKEKNLIMKKKLKRVKLKSLNKINLNDLVNNLVMHLSKIKLKLFKKMRSQWVKGKVNKKNNKTIKMDNYQMNLNKRKNIMVINLKINKKIKTWINKKTKMNNKKLTLKNKRKWASNKLINNRFLNLNNQYQLQELKNQKHQKLGKIILNL